MRESETLLEEYKAMLKDLQIRHPQYVMPHACCSTCTIINTAMARIEKLERRKK